MLNENILEKEQLTPVCVPIYNEQNNNQMINQMINQKLDIQFQFKIKKCFCFYKKNFFLHKFDQQWELSFNNNNSKKYFFEINNYFQFKNILINLGIKDKNYIIDVVDLYYKNKKINFYKSDNLLDALEWCLQTSNDLDTVTRVLY